MLAVLNFFAAEGGAKESSTRFILPATEELLWGSVAFVFILVLFIWKVFPMYRKTLAERTKAIQGSLQQAEKAKSDADAMMAEYRSRQSNAAVEANRVLEEARKTAETVRRDIIARAEAEAAEIVGRARADLGAEKERAMAELRGSVATLSIKVAEKVLAKELSNDASQRSFVDATIAELARMEPGRN